MTLLVQTVLDPTPESVAVARDAVCDGLTRVGLERLSDDVCLLTSELVTNAVRHAGTRLRLWVESDGRSLRVAVQDDDRRPPQPRRRRLREPGGLGLAIVDVIATRWGYEPTPEGGKVVWFELDASTAPSRRRAPRRSPALDHDGVAATSGVAGAASGMGSGEGMEWGAGAGLSDAPVGTGGLLPPSTVPTDGRMSTGGRAGGPVTIELSPNDGTHASVQ